MNAVRLHQAVLMTATLAGPLFLTGCLSLAIGGSGTRRETQWTEHRTIVDAKSLELESRISAIENRLTTVENRVRALREDEAKRQKVSHSELNAVGSEVDAIKATLRD